MFPYLILYISKATYKLCYRPVTDGDIPLH